MAWGFYEQGSDQQLEISELGIVLAKKLTCPVHYPAYDKKLYECHCGVVFPHYVVKAAQDSGNWKSILDLHTGKITR